MRRIEAIEVMRVIGVCRPALFSNAHTLLRVFRNAPDGRDVTCGWWAYGVNFVDCPPATGVRRWGGLLRRVDNREKVCAKQPCGVS